MAASRTVSPSSVIIIVIVDLISWRGSDRAPAARYLHLMGLGIIGWGLADGLGMQFTRLDVQTAFGLAIYPGVAAVTLGFL